MFLQLDSDHCKAKRPHLLSENECVFKFAIVWVKFTIREVRFGESAYLHRVRHTGRVSARLAGRYHTIHSSSTRCSDRARKARVVRLWTSVFPGMHSRTLLVLLVVCACYTSVNSECTININSLPDDAPLILATSTRSFLSLRHSPRGAAVVPEGFMLTLLCPKTLQFYNFFRYLPRYNELVVQCLPGNQFSLVGHNRTYHFDYLHCANKPYPVILKTNSTCFGPLDNPDVTLNNRDNTRLIIGYETDYDFLPVYEVCFDNVVMAPKYAATTILPDIQKRQNKELISNWFTEPSLYKDLYLDEEYKCHTQSSTYYRILSRDFFNDYARCCFQKTRLVTGQDLVYPAQQIATYADVNSVPMCDQNNWIRVQDQVRQLAVNLDRQLNVWTGVYKILRDVSGQSVTDRDLYIHFSHDRDKAVPVPLFTWKVVYDPYSERGVAIITLNDQKASRHGSVGLLLCRDVCPYLIWLNIPSRTDFKDGFTYCCEVGDFVRGFNYVGINPFPKYISGLLTHNS